MDNGLDIILTSYPLPLFIMGAKRILGHFKKLTKHAGAVIDYILAIMTTCRCLN
ncbi:MAG: hypothetical protein IPL84_12275 [Chitinophagaceae bacterium]|nr:hypothetical protein [Chitinophagaceae bacterium]